MKTHAGRKLSRRTGARKALLRTMAASLLQHEQIRTTRAKAKEVSRFTDHMISVAKRKNLLAHREVAATFPSRDLRKKIFDVLVPRYQDRQGGCTRVNLLAARVGDGAEMALVRLIS